MFRKVVSMAVAAMVSLSLLSVDTYASTSKEAKALKNGTYKVNVSLIKENSEEPSMAAGALENDAKLTVKDGVKTIDITFKPLQMFGLNGHLTELKYFNSEGDYKKYYYSQLSAADKQVLLKDVKVISQYDDKDLNGETKSFLQTAEFALPSDDDEIYLHTKVDAMSNPDGTGGYADVKLKINYADAQEEKTEGSVLKNGIYELPFVVCRNTGTKAYAALNSFFDGKAKVEVRDGKMKAFFNVYDKNSKNQCLKSLTAYFNGDFDGEGTSFAAEKTVEKTCGTDTLTLPQSLSLDISNKQAEIMVLGNVCAEDNSNQYTSYKGKFVMDYDKIKFVGNLAESKPENPKEDNTVLDKNNLKDGKYSVQLYLWNASKDAASMANECIVHDAVIDVKNGVKTLSFSTKPMTFAGITANLDTLQYTDKNGEIVDADVISRNLEGKPNAFSFVLPSSDEFIDVEVNPHVAMMGNKPIAARLKVDYSTLKQTENGALKIDNTTAVRTEEDNSVLPKTNLENFGDDELLLDDDSASDDFESNMAETKDARNLGLLALTAVSLMAAAYALGSKSRRLNKTL